MSIEQWQEEQGRLPDEPTPYIPVPFAPDVPTTKAPDVPYKPQIPLEGPLSWEMPGMPQLPYQDERQYNLSWFGENQNIPDRGDPRDFYGGAFYQPDRFGIGGEGTPAELTAGGTYGVSSYQWSSSPNARQLAAGMGTKQIRLPDGTLMTVPTNATDLMKQGKTYKYGADQAAISTLNYINNFGYPSYLTAYVVNKFGWDDEKMADLDYVQTADGHWVRGAGDEPAAPGGGGYDYGGGAAYYGGGYGGGYDSRYAGGSYVGLVNWRIGL